MDIPRTRLEEQIRALIPNTTSSNNTHEIDNSLIQEFKEKFKENPTEAVLSVAQAIDDVINTTTNLSTEQKRELRQGASIVREQINKQGLGTKLRIKQSISDKLTQKNKIIVFEMLDLGKNKLANEFITLLSKANNKYLHRNSN
ncbi:MAG: hypothetical protein HRT47_03290 [Candidatus Caenarcaniphilales bacterium]|nr:hypothetical protein [Candidatus Caenarcaniphilales bacterium]